MLPPPERQCIPVRVLFLSEDDFVLRTAEDNDAVVSLIRQFHMIRAEFHSVVASDYDGLSFERGVEKFLDRNKECVHV